MIKTNSTMAEQIAQAATDFEQQRTGHLPKSVTVVLSENTLVVTMHGTWSPAEPDLAKTPDGAARVQVFHRQLFSDSWDTLRQDITRITGAAVCEATVEVETTTGFVHVFTAGTMVEVFLLARSLPAETWSGSGPVERSYARRYNMLVLSRKSRESVVVGGSGPFEPLLKVTVLEIKGDRVRLGFEADAGIPVHRWEVWERIRAGGRPESLGEDPATQAAG